MGERKQLEVDNKLVLTMGASSRWRSSKRNKRPSLRQSSRVGPHHRRFGEAQSDAQVQLRIGYRIINFHSLSHKVLCLFSEPWQDPGVSVVSSSSTSPLLTSPAGRRMSMRRICYDVPSSY